MVPAALFLLPAFVLLLVGPSDAQTAGSGPRVATPAEAAAPRPGAQRPPANQAACDAELASLDSEIDRYRRGEHARDGAGGSGDSASRVRQYEQLREAAGIFGRHGRSDACRMMAYEIRSMWDFEQWPMRGTNSP